jgi:hypothetical protein
MIICDRTGRKLKVGQIVDVFMAGMFNGKILDIKETSIALGPGQTIHPHVVITIPATPFIGPDGKVSDVYIIQEADPRDPVVINAESKTGIKLVP